MITIQIRFEDQRQETRGVGIKTNSDSTLEAMAEAAKHLQVEKDSDTTWGVVWRHLDYTPTIERVLEITSRGDIPGPVIYQGE